MIVSVALGIVLGYILLMPLLRYRARHTKTIRTDIAYYNTAELSVVPVLTATGYMGLLARLDAFSIYRLAEKITKLPPVLQQRYINSYPAKYKLEITICPKEDIFINFYSKGVINTKQMLKERDLKKLSDIREHAANYAFIQINHDHNGTEFATCTGYFRKDDRMPYDNKYFSDDIFERHTERINDSVFPCFLYPTTDKKQKYIGDAIKIELHDGILDMNFSRYDHFRHCSFPYGRVAETFFRAYLTDCCYRNYSDDDGNNRVDYYKQNFDGADPTFDCFDKLPDNFFNGPLNDWSLLPKNWQYSFSPATKYYPSYHLFENDFIYIKFRFIPMD